MSVTPFVHRTLYSGECRSLCLSPGLAPPPHSTVTFRHYIDSLPQAGDSREGILVPWDLGVPFVSGFC